MLRALQTHVLSLSVDRISTCVTMRQGTVQGSAATLSSEDLSELAAALHARLNTHASYANTLHVWPEGAKLEAPHIFSPRKEARAKVNPGMYAAEVDDLLKQGGLVLQIIDTGEEVPVKKSEDGEDLEMASLAHADLWGPVQTFFPHRVPVGDRLEGLSSLGRLLVAAVEQVVAVAGFEAVEKLKVCALGSRACDTSSSTQTFQL